MAEDIANGSTLPARFYRDADVFDMLIDNVFRKTWQFIGSTELLNTANQAAVELLPGTVDEPLLLTKDRDGALHCLSNVCTHRGSLLVTEAAYAPLIRCPYHGRCFDLRGTFRSMPGFEGVKDFPTVEDNLPQLGLRSYGPMLFTRLDGDTDFDEQFSALLQSLDWYDPGDLEYRPGASRDYEVDAHWCLYVDNYLEGFHVPYVHPGLNNALSISDYAVRTYANSVLQIGFADEQEEHLLDIPAKNAFYGQRVYALYWWVFPNIMFNIYPWGISLNVVQPVNINKTRIRFLTFAKSGFPEPDVSSIHDTEVEDERIVELVQKGVRSSLYRQGRYSVRHEQGVHLFHNLLRNITNYKSQ